MFRTVCFCLIFPALNINYVSEKNHSKHHQREIKIYNKSQFKVQLVLGPQNFSVRIEISLELRSNGITFKNAGTRNSIFSWNECRNVLYGRTNGAEMCRRKQRLQSKEAETLAISTSRNSMNKVIPRTYIITVSKSSIRKQ